MSQLPMSAYFEQKLLPGERIISLVEDLSINFYFVPNAPPWGDAPGRWPGALALTNRRLMALYMHERRAWKWVHIPALNSLWERPPTPNRPQWPYQAMLMAPGGVVMVVQTEQRDEAHTKLLSSLLNQAILSLGTARDDTGSSAAIIAHEDAERRRSPD